MTHICVGKLNIIGSDNVLSPGRRQAIIWTNAGVLLFGPLGTNFSEILVVCKMAAICLGLNELMQMVWGVLLKITWVLSVCQMCPLMSRREDYVFVEKIMLACSYVNFIVIKQGTLIQYVNSRFLCEYVFIKQKQSSLIR